MSGSNVWHAIEFITSIFEVMTMYMFLSGFLLKCKVHKVFVAMGIIICSGILIIINLYGTPPIISVALTIIMILISSFMFDETISQRLFATLLIIVILILSEMLALYTIMMFTSVTSVDVLKQGNLRFMGIIISKLFMFVLLKAICLFKKKYYVKIPKLYWGALLSIPIISIFTVHLVFVFNSKLGTDELAMFSLIVTLGILYSNFIIFYLFDAILGKAEVQVNNTLLERQLKSQLEHYKELEISSKEVLRVKHDIKNHLICIKEQIKDNKNQSAIEYIESTYNLLFKGNKFINTGNYVIDCILNAKQLISENYNIKFTCMIQIPGALKIDPLDICIIFGNALDNAIEANNRVNNLKQRFIDINIIYQNNFIICKIKNKTDGKLKKLGEKFISSKGENACHGLGIENIKETLLKYNGTLDIIHNDDIFELKFMLQNS